MRHYYNRLSSKNFCELKIQPKSNNYAMRGSILGTNNEIYCLKCVVRKEHLGKQAEIKLGRSSHATGK